MNFEGPNATLVHNNMMTSTVEVEVIGSTWIIGGGPDVVMLLSPSSVTEEVFD